MMIVVIWILAILSLMALGLSRRMSVELALTKYAMNKLKARYIAEAGLQYTLAQIESDSKDSKTSGFDNFWQCGIHLQDEQTPETLFHKIAVKDGYFDVSYLSRSTPDTKPIVKYGMQDEEQKINLNALDAQNIEILKELFIIRGLDEKTADALTQAILNWRRGDKNNLVTQPPAETAPVSDTFSKTDEASAHVAFPYPLKGRAFDHIEELLLIPGFTSDLFTQIKEFVTVFPKNTSTLRINFSTASADVLTAVARTVVGAQTNTTLQDVDSMVKELLTYRQGDDGIDGTKDDRILESDKIGLNSKESAIFQTMSKYMTMTSQFLRVRVIGTELNSGTRFGLDTVIARSNLAIVAQETQ